MRPRRHTLSTPSDVAHRTRSNTSSTSSNFTLVLVDDGECQLWQSSARRVQLRLACPEWTVLQAAITLYAPPSWFVMNVDVMVVIQDTGVQLVTAVDDWEAMKATTTRITVLPTPAGSGLHIPLLQAGHTSNGAPNNIGTSHSHRRLGHTTHRQLEDVIIRARVIADRTLAPALEPTPQPTPWPSSPEAFLSHVAGRLHSTPEEMSGGPAISEAPGGPTASPSPSPSPSPSRPKASTTTHYGDNDDEGNDDDPGDTTIRAIDEEDKQDPPAKKYQSQSQARPRRRDSKPDPHPYAIPPVGHRREHWVPFPLIWNEPQTLHERRGLDMRTLDMTKVDEARGHHADAPPPPNTPDHTQPHLDHNPSIERPQRSSTSRASWGNWFAWSPWWVRRLHSLLTHQITETHTFSPSPCQPADDLEPLSSAHIFSSWPSAQRQLLTHFSPGPSM